MLIRLRFRVHVSGVVLRSISANKGTEDKDASAIAPKLVTQRTGSAAEIPFSTPAFQNCSAPGTRRQKPIEIHPRRQTARMVGFSPGAMIGICEAYCERKINLSLSACDQRRSDFCFPRFGQLHYSHPGAQISAFQVIEKDHFTIRGRRRRIAAIPTLKRGVGAHGPEVAAADRRPRT